MLVAVGGVVGTRVAVGATGIVAGISEGVGVAVKTGDGRMVSVGRMVLVATFGTFSACPLLITSEFPKQLARCNSGTVIRYSKLMR